jgi:AraC-like DNA-binding protein
VIGVTRRAVVQPLTGTGGAYGAKLRPGALRAFGVQEPWRLENRSLSVAEVFPTFPAKFKDAGGCPHEIAAAPAEYLALLEPRRHRVFDKALEITKRAAWDRAITRVEQLVLHFGLAERTMRDLFRRSLGVSPKWVIRCYHLQEALIRLDHAEPLTLSSLALDLGYCDQAHFTPDLCAVTGRTPGSYSRGCLGTAATQEIS